MLLETVAIWVGRNVPLPGSGRVLTALYPHHYGAPRFVKGVRRRRDGLLVDVDSRNVIDWNLLFRGEYEPQMGALLRILVPQGGVAIDVGANVGAHTLTLSRAVGSTGCVLAFEPNPITRAALRRNVDLNGFSNIHIYDCALGASAQVLPLRVPRIGTPEYANQGLASLVALETPHEEVRVQVRTLDQIDAEGRFTRLDLVKIDVQGYECHVLEGMRGVLDAYGPALIFEFEDWAWAKAGADIERLNDVIRRSGYELWRIAAGRHAALTRLVEASHLPPHAELLALKSGDSRAAMLRAA